MFQIVPVVKVPWCTFRSAEPTAGANGTLKHFWGAQKDEWFDIIYILSSPFFVYFVAGINASIVVLRWAFCSGHLDRIQRMRRLATL